MLLRPPPAIRISHQENCMEKIRLPKKNERFAFYIDRVALALVQDIEFAKVWSKASYF
jgi:hypothetical protein